MHPSSPIPLLMLLGVSLASGVSRADDGWATSFDPITGPVYSPTSHPHIALEKEVLLFQHTDASSPSDEPGLWGTCEAHFLFRNTSKEAVELEAGFPIRIKASLSLRGEQRFHVDDSGEAGFLQWLTKLSPVETDTDGVSFSKEDLPYLTQSRRVAWEEWTRTMGQAPHGPIRDFHISLDGVDVPIREVFVRSELEPGSGAHRVWSVHLDFLHRLRLAPSATARLVVRYRQNVLRGESDGGMLGVTASISWSYVLGTGATWKGPIGKLFFLAPPGSVLQLPPAFKLRGSYRDWNLHVAEAYEPGAHDAIHLMRTTHRLTRDQLERLEESGPEQGDAPGAPRQPGLQVQGASSALEGKTRTLGRDRDREVERHMKFGPLSLFDGLPESAWCEGVRGEGKGEWVAFSLKHAVIGLEVFNGFQKVSPEQRATESSEAPPDTYLLNGRPKILAFTTPGGKVKARVTLQDTPAKQSFADFQLPAGSYRVRIEEVYPGMKYRDTCLGELSFPISEPDEFLRGVVP